MLAWHECPQCGKEMEVQAEGFSCKNCQNFIPDTPIHKRAGSSGQRLSRTCERLSRTASVEKLSRTASVTSISCDHSGACSCATSSKALSENENDELLQTYGDFLSEEQQLSLIPLLTSGASIRPTLLELGLIQPGIQVYAHQPSSRIISDRGCEEVSQQPASCTTATFILESGGSQVEWENISDADRDWYESLSSLLSHLTAQGVPPEVDMLECVSQLLSSDGFEFTDTPLSVLARSNPNHLQLTIAIMLYKSVVYFHGISVINNQIFYLIPGEAPYTISIDLLEQIIEEFEKPGSKIHVFQKPEARRQKQARLPIIPEEDELED